MNWRHFWWTAVLGALLTVVAVLPTYSAVETGLVNPKVVPLTQEAYIWQRTWDESVRNAIIERSHHFSTLVVLCAELSWQQNRGQILYSRIDYASLRAAQIPVGLALRIDPYSGPFTPNGKITLRLPTLRACWLRKRKRQA